MPKDAPLLKSLISEIERALRELDRLTLDEEDAHELGAPATPQQISNLEKLIGKPLPPSYRAFLELHNGWADFDGEAKLLAIEDHDKKWVKQRVKDWSDLFEDEGKNPFSNGCIPILLGKTESSYLVLDPRKVRRDGEMEFVVYDYNVPEETFKDFTAFLRDSLNTLEELIEDEKSGAQDDED
jgi:hypothetical protein